jgi:hypothetical protein
MLTVYIRLLCTPISTEKYRTEKNNEKNKKERILFERDFFIWPRITPLLIKERLSKFIFKNLFQSIFAPI